jgi:hypothetical protein
MVDLIYVWNLQFLNNVQRNDRQRHMVGQLKKKKNSE